jgi:uncharacterized protein (DUF1330 family)
MSEAMPSIRLTTSAINELPGHVPDGERLVVLHLLRYRDSVGPGKNNSTGRQSFEHYLQMTRPVLMHVGGRPLWRGQARFVLLGPTGERWDEVMLFSYPSLRAFERFVDDARHQAGLSFRTAALEDSRIVITVAPKTFGKLTWWLLQLSARFRRGRSEPGDSYATSSE